MQPSRTITYYDLSDLQYLSYFLTGIEANQSVLGYKFKVSNKVPDIITSEIFNSQWRGFLQAIGLFQVEAEDQAFFFCIDARDPHDPAIGTAYHYPLLEIVRKYFKVNYNRVSVETAEILHPYKNKIEVAPAFLPLRPPKLHRYYASVVANTSPIWTARRRGRRIKDNRRLITLERIRQWRTTICPSLDIFFVVVHYGESVHQEHDEFRYEIVRRLRERTDLRVVAGFVGPGSLPGKYEPLQIPHYSYRDYLANLASARIGIYVRGVYDCISFKFGQLLALGKPIVGQKLHNQLDVLYETEHMKYQFAHESPEAIINAASDLLATPTRLSELATANENFFDTRLDPKPAVFKMLRTMLNCSC